MIIFPAVDVQAGKAVRLRRGRKHEATVYADNPVELAEKWKKAGATWLHLIDLDGAFSGSPVNKEIIRSITRATDLATQVGGGIRSLQTAEAYLEAGASRLIIGTVALEQPKLFKDMCAAFPGQIGVSLDAENRRLKSEGWVKDAGLTISDVIARLEEDGAAFIIYTDIERDGLQTGVNLAALADLLAQTSLPVISAGGISRLEDVQALASLKHSGNLEGAISGRAICEGTLDLAACLNWLNQNQEA